MIASLGMYDGGALERANDALWSVIADSLRREGIADVPERLTRTRALEEMWADERLLLGQICGYPYAASFADRLTVVGVPRYAAPGCEGNLHRSFVVVRADSPARTITDLSGLGAAINDADSMTGRHLLGDALLEAGAMRRSNLVVTGSHAASLAAVASGGADFASIDCVSFVHAIAAKPALANETRIIAETAATPCLPFVVSSALGPSIAEAVGRALRAAVVDRRTLDARSTLCLSGIDAPRAGMYDRTLVVAARANRLLGAA